ncbi:MAG: hypothetical protein ACTS9Y_15705 [Methylophilus sp.]|uniref:hypothetical protein n=1 Tax=Methylophilus sp. TaxID=29541 RepID=UPI003F9F07B9
MKYFIISVVVAVICLLIQRGSAPSQSIVADGNRAVCVANISAGALCLPSAQAQQQFVLVRGQLLPL